MHKSLMKKLTSDVLTFKIVLKDWKIAIASNKERKYELFREINRIKLFLKQVKLVKNITFNSIKLMKIFNVTMLSLKYAEKNRKTRNKLTIKVFIINHGFCRRTWRELMGLLWQSLLRETGLSEQTFLGWTGLLGQTLTGRTGLDGKTVVARAGLLKQIYLNKQVYLDRSY